MATKHSHAGRYWPLYVLGAIAISILLIAEALASPEEFDWPSWVQAVGSIAAIVASGMIATIQADRQLSDARYLQKAEQAKQAFRLAVAVQAVSDKSVYRVLLAIRRLEWDRETIHAIGEGDRWYDRNLLVEVKSDLLSIPVHELPSGDLMHSLMAMQSLARQLHENVEKALIGHRNMEAVSFVNFFNMLDNAHLQMCLHLIDVERAVRRIRNDADM